MKYKESILGYEVSNKGLVGDVETAFSCIKKQDNGRYMACANPHSLVVASKDSEFKKALRNADLLLPDGIGILLAAKILGSEIKERVAGYEFFQGLNEKTKEEKIKYFFLGSTENVLSLIKKRLSREYPHIEVVGVHSPPFKETFTEEDDEKMVDIINKAKPDVLWVGMTAPKQEKWIYKNRNKLQVPFIGAIGAVFDFYAGTRNRAPQWVCNIGLEWLPRFVREPVRLWRRNIVSSPIFLKNILIDRLKRNI